MPGVYLMPNGKVASVDLGDGRVSLVSRAKFEECCCPPFCEKSFWLNEYAVSGKIYDQLFPSTGTYISTKGNAIITKVSDCFWSGFHDGEIYNGVLDELSDFTFEIRMSFIPDTPSWEIMFFNEAFRVKKLIGRPPTGLYNIEVSGPGNLGSSATVS